MATTFTLKRLHGLSIWFVLNTPICHSVALERAHAGAETDGAAFTTRVRNMRRARRSWQLLDAVPIARLSGLPLPT